MEIDWIKTELSKEMKEHIEFIEYFNKEFEKEKKKHFDEINEIIVQNDSINEKA